MKYPQRRRTAAPTFAAITAFLLAALTGTTLNAREWQAWVGAQSHDLGSQALAFLPNELWIHTNDSIRSTLASTETHTVTFMAPGQARLLLFGGTFLVQNGCGGLTPITPDGASFDGSTCVNSGMLGTFDPIVGPRTYSVKFPSPGNFKLTCMVHVGMEE
jgi:plastocyanin